MRSLLLTLVAACSVSEPTEPPQRLFDLDARVHADPVTFVDQNRALLGLDADVQLRVARVDRDDLQHVYVDQIVDGLPVFRGGIGIHMDADGGIFRVIGGEVAGLPSNGMLLTQTDAGNRVLATLGAANPLDLDVQPRVFHVTDGDDRYAYQVVTSWKSPKGFRSELAVIDAESGETLHQHSLVNNFTGTVFTSHPTSTADTRVSVSFDGDATASPNGWVDTTNLTRGNNVVAATDLNGNNTLDTTEIQPAADAGGDFTFPWTAEATTAKEAGVVNAFYFANDFHDRAYALGFTETAGNAQSNNFGRGGAGGDDIILDVQDGSGTDNANCATPPDGTHPRCQMFVFTYTGGTKEDGAVDGSVLYHEQTHIMENRLVGGGSTGCLGGVQSSGMAEGWADFVAGSFLNEPIVGAWVAQDFTKGIRTAPMNNSPYTYANIKDGTSTEAHEAGEIWAATLWDIRTALGATVTNRLVVAGLKLTPCSPSMLQARDAIIQADQNTNGGANRCTLWSKFAARQMGSGASSPDHNSTSTVTTSTAVPSDCLPPPPPPPPPGTTYISTDVPKAIPDNNTLGVSSTLTIPSGLGNVVAAKVTVDISHTYRGDLEISLIAPDGTTKLLSNREGGSADNFQVTALDVTPTFSNHVASGTWRLKVRDLAAQDVGTINVFKLTLSTTSSGSSGTTFKGSNNTAAAIPDNNTTGISSTISSAGVLGLQIQTVQVRLNITHTWRGDLAVTLTSPAGQTMTVVAPASSDSNDNITGVFNVTGFTSGSNGTGTWTLKVVDKSAQDLGTLNSWSIGVNTTAP